MAADTEKRLAQLERRLAYLEAKLASNATPRMAALGESDEPVPASRRAAAEWETRTDCIRASPQGLPRPSAAHPRR